jgi:hypothetical protein
LTNNGQSFLLIAIMNYKTLVYIISLIVFSALIGGGAVYIATNNKSKPNPDQGSNTSISSSPATSVNSTIDEKISSSSLIKSSALTSSSVEKPEGQKFTGWLGSTNIEMYLDFKQDKITGKYYNSYDKKWYTLDGNYRDNNNGQSGTVELNEYDGNLITGTLSFGSTNPRKFANMAENNSLNDQGYLGMGGSSFTSLPAGQYYTGTIRTMTGFYYDKKQNSFDLFVSSDQTDIDNFVDQTKDLKVVRLDTGNPGDATLFEQNGKYYFSYEDWKIPKDTKVGDKLRITGKIRSYNNSQWIEVKPYIDQNNQGQNETTSQGIFQISEAKKV